MKSTLLTLAVLAAIFATGCGGSTNDSTNTLDQPGMEKVAQDWADAFGAGDIDTMCNLTADPGSTTEIGSCKDTYIDNAYARSMANQSIERSEYVGNEGVVQFSNGDVIQMRVKNGAWTVFSFGGKQPYKIGYDPFSE